MKAQSQLENGTGKWDLNGTGGKNGSYYFFSASILVFYPEDKQGRKDNSR